MKQDTAETFTLSEICRICGKTQLYVRNIQKALGLPIPENESRYTANYLHFIQKVINLRTFSIPLEDISDLFTKERSVLRLLKMDALSTSATWYLDQCDDTVNLECQLLLTGYNVGFPVTGGSIQANLDFGNRDPELFNSREMGEDVQLVLDEYLKLLSSIKSRVTRENPVLQQALDWSKAVFKI
jgi:hypothetical protein